MCLFCLINSHTRKPGAADRDIESSSRNDSERYTELRDKASSRYYSIRRQKH